MCCRLPSSDVSRRSGSQGSPTRFIESAARLEMGSRCLSGARKEYVPPLGESVADWPGLSGSKTHEKAPNGSTYARPEYGVVETRPLDFPDDTSVTTEQLARGFFGSRTVGNGKQKPADGSPSSGR